MNDDARALLLICVILALYFLPWLVAWARGVRKSVGIFLVNALLGWTLLGWLAALIWAVQAETVAEYDEAVSGKSLDEERLARAVAAALEEERRKAGR